MTIKHVLVPLSSEVDTDSVLGSSFLIAQEFNAHLDVIFYKFPLGGPMSLETVSGLSGGVIQERVEEQDDCALQARQYFDAELKQRKIDYLDAAIPATMPSAAWRVVEDAPFQGITRDGGGCDLIVVGRSRHNPARAPRDLI